MRTALLAVLSGVVSLLFVTCAAPSPSAATEPPSRGAALYTRHCAVCHGQDGDANTAVAELLLPRPTPFRDGLFKLVSTTNGMPTDDDLVATLRRGMPGSTMMSWGWMPETDLRELAREVRRIAIRGRTEAIVRTAAIAQRPLSVEQAAAEAERALTPGAAIDPGTAATTSDANTAEGKRLYEQHCAVCHGTDGRGLPATRQWPTDGTWLWPRDLTSGYLRGGLSHRDLAFRVRAGMPGAHMPPAQLSTAETELVVHYVKKLVPEAAGDHHAQWRRTVRVARSATLPGVDDDAAWANVDAVRLPLAPLWWRAEAVNELWLRAAHDGNDVVLRLEWADASRDDQARPDARMGDGAAIQFARAIDPPLFAMGSVAEPVNVWRWHAFDPKATAGMVDLVARLHDAIDVPVGTTMPAPRSESLTLHGLGSPPAVTESGLPLDVTTRWQDGRWTATFRRSLVARSGDEIDLTTAGPVLMAFAIWDGHIDTHPGSKSITTWHVLELQH